jgi:cellulose synthase/poly-beta-1,6-N-acetylglucosamine synthase-like glycosyltransferase
VIAILVVLYFLLFTYLFIVSYFVIGWARARTHNPNYHFYRYPTLTIIIPVRNEEQHIAKLLADIQSQTYPSEFIEVLVIDDDSTDNTIEIINGLNYKNVKVIPLKVDEKINSYKKRAITLGVNHSQAELIVTTDGDCRVPENWIACIVDFYLKEDVQLISAPVSYHSEKNWFEKVQTIEFQYLICAAAACINNGMPNTCNGANMIYTRELFHAVKGYEGIDNVASGDDEMLLHKVFKKNAALVGFLKNRSAIVKTYAKKDFKSFLQQRKRWASKSTIFFDYRSSFLLSSVFLFNLSLLLSVPFSFYNHQIFIYLQVAFIFKFLFDSIVIIQTLFFFKKLTYIPFIILVELLYTPYIVTVGLLGNLSSTYIWKGRKVR